jgi:hypothetical protein
MKEPAKIRTPMKVMKATITVEFQAQHPNAPDNLLNSALGRGMVGLRSYIEQGLGGGGQTGIKKGNTTKIKVAKQKIVAD